LENNSEVIILHGLGECLCGEIELGLPMSSFLRDHYEVK
jgi:hypothetical protein